MPQRGTARHREQCISAVEDTDVETEKLRRCLQERLDDQAHRGRRKNLRIVGLPESSEGTLAMPFIDSQIP